MSELLLRLAGVSKSFRGLIAVDGVSFEIEPGAVVALIGPNGAGKTTLFNIIAGALAADAGEIRLDELSLRGLAPHQVCQAGIARTFQLVRPFAQLSVEDNVLIGALKWSPTVAAAREEARRLLALLELEDKARRLAVSLTLADRKRLELARALATRPRLLLLDEVMAGLRPTETDRMVAMLAELNRRTGLTILLIEHVMRAVMQLAQRVIVLNHGEKISEGRPEDVVRDPAVLECYLGQEALA
ncbi:MAG: ABC transporter ATP-binding protein [Proteobacteria bacterium]|nr:ABC transporter ATP-binding protein [Pseudomonadota bacterium]MBI3497532.1 ABC transporter ATP-binding protein [Pseudomonadota bacterium]